MKSRNCEKFEQLVDLIVADRLKDSLSAPCLKYCLSVEGNKVLSSSELATLADTFDANYSSDGRYRGGAVLTSKDDGTRGYFGGRSQGRGKPLDGNTSVTPGVGRGAGNSTNPTVTPGNNPAANDSEQPTIRPQRKCFNCGSLSQIQINCPKPRARHGGNTQATRTNACKVADTADDETAVKSVQISRCVVETPRDNCSLTDWKKGDTTTLKLEQQVNGVAEITANEVDVTPDIGDDVKHVHVSTSVANVTNVIHKSPLTYVQLFVENRGPYKCLADSGTEMPVAKRAVVQDVMSADQPA